MIKIKDSLKNEDDDFSQLRKCFFCGKSPAPNRCPRCDAVYCGLACYKSERHLDCSENFYKESFMKELKFQSFVDQDEKSKILEMIEKTYEDNPLFEGYGSDNESLDDVDTLADRLKEIDVENLKDEDIDLVLKQMTKKEKDEFHQMIDTGEIFNIYHNQTGDKWEPYWFSHNCSVVRNIKDKKPSLNSGIDKFVDNSSSKVAFNLINVIFPYSCIQTIFNGCGHIDLPLEFSDSIISCSVFLAKNQVLESVEEAVIDSSIKCSLCCKERNLSASQRFLIECIRFTSHILIGPNPDECSEYVKRALSEFKTACQASRKLLRNSTMYSSSDLVKKRKLLFSIIKKIEFLIVWVEKNKETLSLLSIEVVEIFKKKVAEYSINKRENQNLEKLNYKSGKNTCSPKIIEMS